ncbi:MAG: hypothetical protein Q7T54_00030 [Candidatus Levybacteria bacterium]|nr:hypothetical protein [Candidatus Levybacteria bacterium]
MESVGPSAEQKEKFGNNDCALLENVLAGHSEHVTIGGKTIISGPTTISEDFKKHADMFLKPPAVLKKLKNPEDVNALREGKLLPAGLLPMFETALGYLMLRGLTPVLKLQQLDYEGKINAIEIVFAHITRTPKALRGGEVSSVEEISVKPKEEWDGIDFRLASGFEDVFDQPQLTENSMFFPIRTPQQ